MSSPAALDVHYFPVLCLFLFQKIAIHRRLHEGLNVQMTTPIIVVGMNRSGTKWVSNILCNHEDVIGVQSERHFGILETNMFGTMQDKFDLSSPEDYVGFLEMWSKTEFFRRTDIDKQMFYELAPRPRCDRLSLSLVFHRSIQSSSEESAPGRQFSSVATRCLGRILAAAS